MTSFNLNLFTRITIYTYSGAYLVNINNQRFALDPYNLMKEVEFDQFKIKDVILQHLFNMENISRKNLYSL